MKTIKSSLKNGEMVIGITTAEDFWYLSHIIDKGDIVRSRTFRKIKIGGSDERSQDVIKKPVVLDIIVEKTEVAENGLRVSGKINSDFEDIRKGSFHTITLEINSVLTITKPKWLKFQLDKIKESSLRQPNILIVALERDNASFALLKNHGFEFLADMHGEVSKKLMKENVKENFYENIIKQIKEYVPRYNIQHVILASPAFWKDDLLKELKDKELSKMITTATCHGTGKNGINEIINRDEIKNLLKQERLYQETRLVEDILKELGRDGLATYSLKYARQAALAGAVKELLITETIIQKFRGENRYNELDELMSLVENSSGNVHVISSEHDAGKQLNGLSGIAAILRYKIYFQI